jgi:hypothetical protein
VRTSLVFALAAAAVLPGCTAVGGVVIVGAMANDAARYYGGGTDPMGRTRPPEPDPTRKINEQDCTRPMVFDGGNLHCK